jgi:hypothetical protein
VRAEKADGGLRRAALAFGQLVETRGLDKVRPQRAFDFGAASGAASTIRSTRSLTIPANFTWA